MVHRRTLYDDALGVGEPLNETAYGTGLVVRGKHLLIIESPESSAVLHRVASQNFYMHPLSTFALPHLSYENYTATYVQSWSALDADLPLNIHLLTFDQLDANEYLIRIEHYFELNEDSTNSQSAIVNLQKLFDSRGIISDIDELTLAGNLALADMDRLDWTTIDNQSSKNKRPRMNFV